MPIENNSPGNEQRIPAWLLLLTVFITGASVLIIELIGTRVLAPFFGSGIYTWSALISVTLAALSLGYALGGKLVDKNPRPGLLFHICFIAGTWTLLTPWAATILLPLFAHLTDIRLAVLLSSTALFSPNLFLLGMACPFAIRLFSRDYKALGTTSGLVFSISTLGSLLGALFAGFYLVPNHGVLNILTFCGSSLLLLTALGYIYSKLFIMLAIPVITALVITSGLFSTPPAQTTSLQLLDSSPSFYGHVQVLHKDGYKVLLVDGIGQNYVTGINNNEITYINFLSSLPFAREASEKDSRESLVIGLGAGQLPILLEKTGLNVEVVEIDPVIDAVARKHFGFNFDKEKVYFEDGRLFLRKTTNSYDYIFIDAFNSDQIADHLLTQESLELTRSRLSKGGLLSINITSIVTGDDIASLQASLASTFPYVRTFDENPENELTSIIFLASSSPIHLHTRHSSLTTTQIININQYLTGELNEIHGGLVLSDDFNPVSHQRLRAQLLWRKEMRDFLGEDYYHWAFL